MSLMSSEERVQRSAEEVSQGLAANFSGADLIDAIRELSRPRNVVQLPEREQDVWNASAGEHGRNPGPAAARNVIRRADFISSTLDVSQVAELLARNPSTVRHYSADQRLYSFVHRGMLRFPAWQFVEGRPLAGLEKILPSISRDVHSQAVAGFFLNPNPDLVFAGEQLTPAQWLADGHDPQRVAEQAASLGAII